MEKNFVQLIRYCQLESIQIGTPYEDLIKTLGEPLGEIEEDAGITGVGYGNLFFGISNNTVDSISLKWNNFTTEYTEVAREALSKIGISWYPGIRNRLDVTGFYEELKENGVTLVEISPKAETEWETKLLKIQESGVVLGFDIASGLLEGIWKTEAWDNLI